jgi:hypothetical protein
MVDRPPKPVRLSQHARQQLHFRGATEAEVIRAIDTEPWTPAERGRLECRLALSFRGTWQGRAYASKLIRPIFVEEPTEIVVVTVYVYYF